MRSLGGDNNRPPASKEPKICCGGGARLLYITLLKHLHLASFCTHSRPCLVEGGRGVMWVQYSARACCESQVIILLVLGEGV